MEVNREYIYKYGGKDVHIKRKWINSGTNYNKSNSMNQFIEDNRELINDTKIMRKIWKKYNEDYPDAKVSYQTMRLRLNKIKRSEEHDNENNDEE